MARAAVLAGMELRGAEALRDGRAVAADLTGAAWRERLGLDVPRIDEAEAGRRVAALAGRHALTVHEYFLTDVAGHRAEPALAGRVLRAYDRFLAGLLDALPAETTLALVSDHGNLEDLSHGRHTRNPALFAWRGPPPGRRLRALTDLAPALGEALGLAPPPD